MRGYRGDVHRAESIASPAWDAPLDTAAVLGDRMRRRIYAFARSAGAPVTREQTAAAVGITRKLAAFHLDKLVDAGLLSTRTERRQGVRRAGRTPKGYSPSDVAVRVDIPARLHELLAEILVEAVATTADTASAGSAADRLAHAHGVASGTAAQTEVEPGQTTLSVAERVLDDRGYEPVVGPDGALRLRNCPFHPLADRAPDLVCGLNHAYLCGLLEGLGSDGVEAVLAPRPGECCVEMRSRNA